jgi:ethanolamine utilization protein EutA (predicted chaperonin)
MLSFGIDIGTTTLRMTAVHVESDSSSERNFKIIDETPLCVFTPFKSQSELDERQILSLLSRWQKQKALSDPEVGTVLFTGEAQRADNCFAIGQAILAKWPGLLCAQLDPHLESLVAAFGSGAIELSRSELTPVFHIDIGGGTSNFAWVENGRLVETACLDIGGRKWIVEPESGKILARTRIAKSFEKLKRPVKTFTDGIAREVSEELADVILDFVTPKRSATPKEWIVSPWKSSVLPEKFLLSLSGGVVECWDEKTGDFQFGDLGNYLARALKHSLERRKVRYRISPARGSATALGISVYGFQITGNSLHGKDFKRIRNAPLYDKRDLEKLGTQLPKVFGVWIDFSTATSSDLEETSRDLTQLFSRIGIDSSYTVIFVMKPNLAKAFGYLWEKQAKRAGPRIWAIDQIDADRVPNGPVRTLDLGTQGSGGRIPVVVKTLRLF